MKSVLYVLTALAVMGVAFWAYQENYRTQEASREAAAIRREIGRLRETLGVLNAEWAYLNRPERLRELSVINFDRLGLLPLEPEQFGSARQVSYPLPPELLPSGMTITDPVDVAGERESTP